MGTMTETFASHMRDRGFAWSENLNVISNNPTLLFNISGGVPYEPVIAGEELPGVRRTASLQRCVRTDSWEKIGRSGRHHIAFDMFGHFSMYELDEPQGKRLMIEAAWSYLTERLALDNRRLHATAHPDDRTTQNIWSEIGCPVQLSAQNTDTNPRRNRCGYRSEIVWEKPDGVMLELWNLVFTQFTLSDGGTSLMSTLATDSGVSADRLLTATEDVTTAYETSSWRPVVGHASEQVGSQTNEQACRLADMVKALLCMIDSGVVPGNKTAPYVLRRTVREAYLLVQCRTDKLLGQIEHDAAHWCGHMPSLASTAVILVAEEVARFQRCLNNGAKAARKLLRQHGSLNESDIAFLKDTHGYPEELARQIRLEE